MPQPGFFDIDRRLERISRMGDPLERLATDIPWELFRPVLDQVHEKGPHIRGRAQAMGCGADVPDPADTRQPGR